MIPLMSAERCWAQAMELKAQQEEQPDARKRLHQISRLAKVSPLSIQSTPACPRHCRLRRVPAPTYGLLALAFVHYIPWASAP